ncbi:chaperone protein DnaK [Janthinobacterium sp. HH103]|uniref:Hsp70 family protein n=1 Tax=unclassified Janthinobacterium TaxID=2610881 RepID=UPI000873C13B|nr:MULTISPECIES: Hsp70 family protein [unclassified Janthinobacterium]OEZ66334.1 chaperone protein DnaK [Janthinobacterium sp. HH100]OEZ72365.1 chaperone protein DnaK [Janthinobacterium sp. HH103]QOU74533.1 Chaperone protein HscA [Janthinobacterium sp. HH102]
MGSTAGKPAYLVGIDLGTTNTVVAYAAAGDAQAGINLFAIEQLVAPGEVGARPLLPSLRYHPAAGELAAGDLPLPWPQQDGAGVEAAVLGAFARQLGAQVPGRLVSSAKSWLSHANVDRQAPILPWGADADVAKVSPVAASASYLAYVRAAWNHRFPQAPLEQQELVLTIPASFDEGARALTLAAARMAGLPALRLVEEPQAAFYDFLQRRRATLREDLSNTRRILVCDVGGGTTDFSLIDVAFDDDGTPQLTRSSVGNHLILGGDNMDLALAHLVEKRMAAGVEGGMKLSAARLSQLMERCRAAKELLLSTDAPDSVTVTLLGAGSRLIGGSRSADVTREEVAAMVVDGFFPKVELGDTAKKGRAGIVAFGLPYAQDAAITRHLASFLQQHQGPLPDTLLLNGGVFRADALARRLAETLAHWRGQPLTILHNDNPDVAVARGAVAYALARRGQAPRIGGGSPRSYFLVLGEAGKDHRAVCILPRGSASGEEIRLTERLFALRLGRPVRFHLATSLFESGTPPKLGEIVDLNAGEYLRLPPLASVLHASDGNDKREITVQLATVMTEVGTLEVHCVAEADAGQRWLLEFQLRGEEETQAETSSVPPRVKEAIEKIERIFGGKAQKVETKEVRQLRQHLERGLGGRESWDTPLLRQLFDALMLRARGRRRSAEHERVWLNLAGYCLRPGYGDALDPWRIEQLWALFDAGVQHHKDNQVCAEWWTLWRRVAGGLSTEQQLRLLDDFAFNLQADAAQRGSRPVTLVNGSDDDMLRLGASLERIPGAYKAEVGAWLIKRLQKADKRGEAADTNTLWALARVGARQPFHGSAHEVVDSATVADWLAVLLALDWKKVEPAAFAAAHLARMTGDRSRDIGDDLRATILARLKAVGAPPLWQAMVSEVTQLDEAATKRMLGEALPPGLKLIG